MYSITLILALITIFLLFIYYKKLALKNKFIDKPQNFSSHIKPTPTGAGIIFIFIIALFYVLIIFDIVIGENKIELPNREYLLIFSIIFLGIINFYDDIKHTHPLYRLTAHFICVMISLPLFSLINQNLYYFIPEKVFIIFIVFFWVYIINIFNFLDGADGYLSVNSLVCFLAFGLNSFNKGNFDFDFYLSITMILVMSVYLFFNFPKAKLFMGDCGSITLGYLVGYFTFVLIFNGDWKIALAIIFYPLLDVTLTIFRKMKKGYYPWERLFDYFFLRALKGQSFNHKKILLVTTIYNTLNLLILYFMIIYNMDWIMIFTFLLAIIKIILFNKLSRV